MNSIQRSNKRKSKENKIVHRGKFEKIGQIANLSKGPPNLVSLRGLLSYIILTLNHINGIKKNQIKIKINAISNSHMMMVTLVIYIILPTLSLVIKRFLNQNEGVRCIENKNFPTAKTNKSKI